MEEVVLAVDTDEPTSERLRTDLAKVTDKEIFVQKRENLSGIAADFITILQATAPIVAAALPFVIALIKERKVRRVKLGEFEIENPTSDQVQAMWERFQGTAANRKA